MALYSNEEELKGRKEPKKGSAASRITKEGLSASPLSIGASGVREAVRFAKQGFSEAADRPTTIRKIARGARTVATIPVAVAYGASRGPIRAVKRAAGAAGEFATEFMGGDSTVPPTAARPISGQNTPAARVAAPQQLPAPATPVSQSVAATRQSPAASALRVKYGENAGVDGSGFITSSTGSVRMGPDGKIITTGSPVGDSQGAAKLPAEKRRPTRFVTYGGYRLPERAPGPEPEKLRVSDIPPPETIGAVPGYRRKVEATRADIAADTAEEQRLQQAAQFSAGQEQQQGQFETGTLLEQGRFDAKQALAERRVAGTEKQQQLVNDQQKEIQEANQLKEVRDAKKAAEISAARARFDAAETTAERVKAAKVLNSLQGLKIDIPKAGRPAGLTQKETSQQIQNARKIYDEAGGEAGSGVRFPTWMQQNDPRGFQAAFGNLNPREVEDYNEMQGLSDKELLASSFSQSMNPGETPAQFRQRVEAEFRRGRGY